MAYFYKEVSRGLKISKNIKPTNILLKDRKYRFCFKFYRKFVTYEDELALIKDYRNYCFMNLLKVMNSRGYELIESDNNVIKSKKMKLMFESNEFKLEFKYKDLELHLKVTSKKSKKYSCKHVLLFNESFSEESNKRLVKNDEVCTTDAISIWSLARVLDDVKVINTNPLTEVELITMWLDSKINETVGSEELYSRYCPVCKSRNVEANDKLLYTCHNCESIYAFTNVKLNKLWIMRVGRV